MEGAQEHIIEWLKGETAAQITAPSTSWLKNCLVRLAEKYPDDVKIIKINADGSVYGVVPVKFVQIRPPKQVSESQREALRRFNEKKRSEQ